MVEYIVEGIKNLQRNYDLDGINLDYIRYPDYNLTNGGTHTNDWGYSEVSLARFQAATGRSDVPEPTDEQFTQWRRDQVTALVRRIYLEMLTTDARDRLSVNAVTYGHGPSDEVAWEQTRPYANVLQDWSGWAKEGIVDTVTAMNYKREWLPEQELMFDSWNRYLAEVQSDTRRLMVSGPALYLNDLEHSVQQAKEVVGYGLGWSGYSYASVSRTAVDDPAQRGEQREALAAALTSEVFTRPARVPKMGWKHGKQAALLGTVTAPEGSLDQASVELRHHWSGRTYTATTDGSGWFGLVGLPRGRYQVSVNGVFAGEVRIRRGQVTTVELSVTA